MKGLKKRFVKNFASFGSVDLISLLIPFVTMPFLTRTIGIEAYGIYLFYTTILVFGQSFIDYSSNFNGIRDGSSEEHSSLLSSYQTMRYILLCLYILFLYFLLLISENNSVYLIISNSFVYLLAYAIFPNWYFMLLNKVYIYAKTILFSKLFFLLCVLVFIRDESDLPILLLSTSLPYILITLYYLLLSKKNNVIPNYGFNFWGAIKKFKAGLNTFIGVFSPNLYNNIPILILGGLINPAAFSLFAIASRLCSLCIMVQNNAAKSIYPLVFESDSNYLLRNVILINLLFSCVFSLLMLAFGYYGINYVLGSGYDGVFLYLAIMIPSLFFTGVNNSISYIYLLPNGHDKQFRIVSLTVSLVSFFIGIVLIFYYSAIGVSILITIARLLLCIGFVFMYFKLEGLKEKGII